MSRGILDRIIGYGRTGDVTDSTVRTDGNVSFEEVLGHYDPADHGGEADGSTAGHPPHVADPFGTDPATVAEWATDSRKQGLDAASFVDTYDVAVEATVSAAFEHLREEVGEEDRETVDQVEEHLTTALSDVLGSMQSGFEAFDRTAVAADGGSTADLDVEPVSDAGADEPDREQTAATEAAFPVGYETIMDNIGACLFIVDADGDIVFWNRGAEKLTGVDREEAYQVDIAGQAFYHDGRRAKTLADKVLDAPESAHREYDVPKVDDVDYALYRDQSTMTAAGGEEAHISFSAAPLYDDDGELVGVVEMVNDQTEQVLRREHTADLLSELQRTIEEMQDGNYDERASYQTEGYVDEELLSVVDTLNALGEQFETLSDEVHEEMSALYSTSETVSDASQSISAAAIQQDEAMHDISNEISSLSATVEEIASSATEVDSTSSNAEELAQEGRSSAEEAVDLMDDVADSAEHVATDVDQLRSSIDEIDEIVDVIDAIADQTNILALNASIEAARAGEAGEGFAVVADEVKQLAEESQARAGEIEDLIEKVQADTDETVDNLETTTTRIGDVIDQVEEAMERLEEIDHAIRETSNGIQEVADATDEQAASTEEIASMIDEAAEQADEIAEDIQDIASANQEQADRATELRDTVQEYMD